MMRNFFFFLVLLTASVVSHAREVIGHEQKYVATTANIELAHYKQEEILPYLTTLESWSAREFSKAPYLYAPSEEKIVALSDIILVNSKRAKLTLARIDGQIVGMVTTIPFDVPELHGNYFSQHELLKKMRDAGYQPESMLYVCYFLTAPHYHNDSKLVDALYACAVEHAYAEGKSELCYMEDIGPASTKIEPKIEPWGAVIHNCVSTKIQVSIPWPTQLESGIKEVPHTLEFFIHPLL